MASNSSAQTFSQNNIQDHSNLPLWSKNKIYLDRLKLYDLEIYSDSHIDIAKDVDDILNINVSKCHICNISVPNSYIQEHLTSDKHKTFSKIANIALKRTQSHMTTDMFAKIDKLKMEVKETHFCDICAVVVKNTDKENHAMSDGHQNCLKNDKLIEHLVNIYEEPLKIFEGDIGHMSTLSTNFQSVNLKEQNLKALKVCNVESEDAKCETNTDTKLAEDQMKKKKTMKETLDNRSVSVNDKLKNVNNDEKVTVKDSKNTPKTNAEEPVASTSGTNKDRKTNQFVENLVELKQYLHVAKYIHKGTINPTAVSEDTVEVVAANVDRVKVPLENFHGFYGTGQAVVCKLCSDIKSVDGKKHKWTDLHMKNVMLPLSKWHLRQLDDATVHCLLCNTTQPSSKSADHTSSLEHEENFNKYISSNVLTVKNKQIAVANCLKWTPDTISCKLCQFKSKNSNEALNNHVHSSTHIKKLDAFLMSNKILKMPIDNGCYWCGVCQKKIGVYLSTHCFYLEHTRNLKSFNGVVPF